MSWKGTLIAAGAAVTAAIGAGATSAGAYSVSGGFYTGTATATTTFTFGDGWYVVECFNASYAGFASGTNTTSFIPSFSWCSFFGFPATISHAGYWDVWINSGWGVFGGELAISTFATTTISVPIAGCTVTINGRQSFPGAASAVNTSGGVDLYLSATGTSYTASGCPFGSGSDGTFDTNGPVTIPGITIS